MGLWELVLKVRECMKRQMTVKEIQKELNLPCPDRVYKLQSLVEAWSKK